MRGLVLAAVLALAPAFASAADLTLVAPDGSSKVLKDADLAGLPRGTVQLAGKTYEGPLLTYVLRAGGLPVGAKLHGDPMRAYVKVIGTDGYVGLYSLAELDRDFSTAVVVLADHVDGASLSEKEAPWRVASSADKKPWRSVRAVARIEAVIVP